ncbi:DUF58 domain-containing protein [Patulibacter minatonensis]|uniref:DUF58 domain-containing protein n=1 Tax=Patulibacter minatonensis TaxID=298163 RepID=UPI00047AE041|nr:DUF58 domain-containing protein [Patulibacter minatonensis]
MIDGTLARDLRALWDELRPARRRITLVVAPLLLGFGGAAVGSVALFALAVGVLVAYAGCAVLVRVGARRLRVARTIERRETLEGRPVAVRFTTSGLRRLPLHVEVLGGTGTWVPLSDGGGRIDCTIDRPGPHVVDASTLRIRDDLGLFSRTLRVGRPESLLVLPVPATVPPVGRAGGADPAGDPEPDGLRPYVRGTAMSRVHWPSAARGGDLQERVFVTARDRLPLVVVDTAGVDDPAVRDWTARTAAGHVQAFLRAGGCRVLLPGDRRATTVTDAGGHWSALHRRLASLESGSPHRTPGDDRDAVLVRSVAAPADAHGARGRLPFGVVPLDAWSEAA